MNLIPFPFHSLPIPALPIPSSTLALGLMLCAFSGAGISYHLTLDSRLQQMEQKSEQTTQTLNALQTVQEESAVSRSEDYSKTCRQLDELRRSIEPLTRASQEHEGSLADIKRQISGIQTNYMLQMSRMAQDEAALNNTSTIINTDPQLSTTTITPIKMERLTIADDSQLPSSVNPVPEPHRPLRALPVIDEIPVAPIATESTSLPVGPSGMPNYNTPLPVTKDYKQN